MRLLLFALLYLFQQLLFALLYSLNQRLLIYAHLSIMKKKKGSAIPGQARIRRRTSVQGSTRFQGWRR